MRCVVVHTELRDALYAKVDAALVKHPSLTKHRDEIYSQLLDEFDRTGAIPDFSLEPIASAHNELDDVESQK